MNPTNVKVLVAIANHGTRNQHYLDQLVTAYREMPVGVTIVVLSDAPKQLGPGIEVRVGAPSPNPWSLPFAHRTLFRERIDQYDYFIYSEDDTLLTWKVMEAFMRSTEILEENEIAGFVRTEKSATGEIYYSTCHSFFRWIPSSVRERGGKRWAKYSNEHAACFVVSQAQLRRAIAAGGFPIEPHEGRHDMLCAAATDIYTQCGLERLVCIDALDEFTLPHLPNKYLSKMGLPKNEMKWQLEALRRIHRGELPGHELLDPETRMPGGGGSKFYREPADPFLNEMLGSPPKRVLVWGAGDGIFESDLARSGHNVSVVPLDAVMGESCRHRSLAVLSPDALRSNTLSFDAIVLCDVLHLIDEPSGCLAQLHQLLSPAGVLIARIPNLNDIRFRKLRLRDPRFNLPWQKESLGADPYNSAQLKKIAAAAGFKKCKIRTSVPANRRRLNKATLGIFSAMLSAYLYLRLS